MPKAPRERTLAGPRKSESSCLLQTGNLRFALLATTLPVPLNKVYGVLQLFPEACPFVVGEGKPRA